MPFRALVFNFFTVLSLFLALLIHHIRKRSNIPQNKRITVQSCRTTYPRAQFPSLRWQTHCKNKPMQQKKKLTAALCLSVLVDIKTVCRPRLAAHFHCTTTIAICCHYSVAITSNNIATVRKTKNTQVTWGTKTKPNLSELRTVPPIVLRLFTTDCRSSAFWWLTQKSRNDTNTQAHNSGNSAKIFVLFEILFASVGQYFLDDGVSQLSCQTTNLAWPGKHLKTVLFESPKGNRRAQTLWSPRSTACTSWFLHCLAFSSCLLQSTSSFRALSEPW